MPQNHTVLVNLVYIEPGGTPDIRLCVFPAELISTKQLSRVASLSGSIMTYSHVHVHVNVHTHMYIYVADFGT